MSAALPSVQEAVQLHRLRALRVQRAREALAQANAQVRQAAEAVLQREQVAQASRCAMDQLAREVVSSLAPQLPRWSALIRAERERRFEHWERAVDAVIGANEDLAQARDKARQAGADLTRALGREDTVRDLLGQARRAQALLREQRAEVELEDQGRIR